MLDVAAVTSRKLRGHTSTVYAVEFSRDGRRLLSASDDSTARLWNLDDGSSVALLGHDDDVRTARFSSDERTVVTAAMDRTARVWPLARPGQRVLAENKPIEHAWLDAKGFVVQTATELARWDVTAQDAHGTPDRAHRAELRRRRHPSTATSRSCAAADWALDVHRLHGTPAVLEGHRGELTHVEVDRDNRTAYSSSADGTLRAWNLDTGSSTVIVDGKLPIRMFHRKNDGRMVVLYDASVAVSNARGDDHVLGTGPAWCAKDAGFDHGHDRMVVVFCDGRLEVFDAPWKAGDTKPTELAHEPSSLGQVAFSDDDELVAAVSNDTRTIRVWHADGRAGRRARWPQRWDPRPCVVAGRSPARVGELGPHRADLGPDEPRTHARGPRPRALRSRSGRCRRSRGSTPRTWCRRRGDGTVRVWDVPALVPATHDEVATAAAALTDGAHRQRAAGDHADALVARRGRRVLRRLRRRHDRHRDVARALVGRDVDVRRARRLADDDERRRGRAVAAPAARSQHVERRAADIGDPRRVRCEGDVAARLVLRAADRDRRALRQLERVRLDLPESRDLVEPGAAAGRGRGLRREHGQARGNREQNAEDSERTEPVHCTTSTSSVALTSPIATVTVALPGPRARAAGGDRPRRRGARRGGRRR